MNLSRVLGWLRLLAVGLVGLQQTGLYASSSVDSIGDMFDWLTSMNYLGLGEFIVAVGYVSGIGFVITSIYKFKHYKENPTQIPLTAPVALFTVGIVLVYMSGLINSGGYTLLGDEAVAGGYTGSGVCGLPGSC